MAKALIDLDALIHNYRCLKALAPQSRQLAVIKANAYGHGLLEAGKALDDIADGFAVARMEEALALREAGVRAKLLLLGGLLSDTELQQALQHGIDVVLHDLAHVQLLESASFDSHQALSCWLKVNTGMNRLGFSLDQLPGVHERLKKIEGLRLEVLMTHLANADSGQESDQQQALQVFTEAKKLCSEISQYSIANSAAICCYPETHADWNRPGIALYGAATVDIDELALKPVMSLQAPVMAVHDVKAGESVGYGSRWISERDTTIAVVAIGYGDGYPRHARDGTPVWIAGQCYPLAGRVSMDMITVDIGNNEACIKPGDEAVLWGRVGNQRLSADTIAAYADTISYELFCKVTSRVDKEYVGG